MLPGFIRRGWHPPLRRWGDYLGQDRRTSGGRTALVTACARHVAAAIAAHPSLFGQAHGSDGVLNLKEHRKGQSTCNRFGSQGFVSIWNAKAYLPVWKQAAKWFDGNDPAALRRCGLARILRRAISSLPGPFARGRWGSGKCARTGRQSSVERVLPWWAQTRTPPERAACERLETRGKFGCGSRI